MSDTPEKDPIEETSAAEEHPVDNDSEEEARQELELLAARGAEVEDDDIDVEDGFEDDGDTDTDSDTDTDGDEDNDGDGGVDIEALMAAAGMGGSADGIGPDYRSGFVALAGKPNAGKSTLMNAVLGEKLAIVTPKAQTTRDRIHGIYSCPTSQMVFVDMPGIIDPGDLFNEALMEVASEALDGVDVVLHIVDIRDKKPWTPEIVAPLRAAKPPVLLVWTHCDLLSGGDLGGEADATPKPPDEIASIYRDRLAVSGTEGFGVAQLLLTIEKFLPEGPPLFDPEQITDRDLRYLTGELVREKIFLATSQEIPYGVACEVEDFKERPEPRPDYIRMTVWVERDSQKKILIGGGGGMLKKIGAEARVEIEKLVGKKVYLDLWVKVRKNWRKNPSDLRRLGYGSRKKKKRRR